MPAIPVTAGMAVFFGRLLGERGWGEIAKRYWRNPWVPRGSARRGRWLAGWSFGLLRRLDTLLHIPVMPDQTADYGSCTLNWLLTPVGMVAIPAGWPSPATVG